METESGSQPPRPPERIDLIALCNALNAEGARYIVVGGMAIIQQGFLRATEDIDLLIEASPQNIERVRRAMETLPDKAIREMTVSDLTSYTVVRVVDDIVVDLMLKTCGFSYQDAEAEIEMVHIEDTRIPFASAALLLKMKDTGREKDMLDRRYLENKLKSNRKK